MCFGEEIARIDSACTLSETGVDLQESITLRFADGRMAILQATALCANDRHGIICGDKGYIVVDNINNPLHATLHAPDHTVVRTYDAPPPDHGIRVSGAGVYRRHRRGPHRDPVHAAQRVAPHHAYHGRPTAPVGCHLPQTTHSAAKSLADCPKDNRKNMPPERTAEQACGHVTRKPAAGGASQALAGTPFIDMRPLS